MAVLPIACVPRWLFGTVLYRVCCITLRGKAVTVPASARRTRRLLRDCRLIRRQADVIHAPAGDAHDVLLGNAVLKVLTAAFAILQRPAAKLHATAVGAAGHAKRLECVEAWGGGLTAAILPAHGGVRTVAAQVHPQARKIGQGVRKQDQSRAKAGALHAGERGAARLCRARSAYGRALPVAGWLRFGSGQSRPASPRRGAQGPVSLPAFSRRQDR